VFINAEAESVVDTRYHTNQVSDILNRRRILPEILAAAAIAHWWLIHKTPNFTNGVGIMLSTPTYYALAGDCWQNKPPPRLFS
jgi:hypothetical protein